MRRKCKMKKKRVLALIMAALMTGGLMTGCGSSDSGSADNSGDAAEQEEVQEVSLTVWGPQEDQAALEGYDEGILKSMCEAFDEAHPEWEINFEYGVCGEGDARDQVTKDVEAGRRRILLCKRSDPDACRRRRSC